MIVRDLDDLLAVLARGARVDDGEDVDLLAHALQCADLLATRAPDDVELQVAGLVHDVGTILEPDRPATHAATGAHAVEALLGVRVARLVRGHDTAKRYLVATDDAYRSRLSDVSIATLDAQGGVLTPAEVTAFEHGVDADALVTLRRADDDAKVAGAPTRSLDDWRDTIERLTR